MAQRAPAPVVGDKSTTYSSPPDGAFDEWMSGVFGRSWRTTIAGWATGLAGAVGVLGRVIPGVPPVVPDVALALAAVFAGPGLAVAKDHRVTGPDPE